MKPVLSDDQMKIVRWGEPQTISWEQVELPAGKQDIPEWAHGLTEDFMLKYGNDPRFLLETKGVDIRHWEGKVWTREPNNLYIARHPDGRADALYHDDLTPGVVRRWKSPDGTLSIYPPHVPAHASNATGEWVEVERWCTSKSQGFGGAHFDITMEDGREATLIGPWHGGAPEGYTECGIYLITHELLIRLFAHYLPHLRLFWVTDNGRKSLQPFMDGWLAPKAVIFSADVEERRRLSGGNLGHG